MAEGVELSKCGRLYDRGKAIQADLQRKIVQDIIEESGDFVTGFFPGLFSVIADKNRVKYDTVRKIWKEFVANGHTEVVRRAAGIKHLQQEVFSLSDF